MLMINELCNSKQRLAGSHCREKKKKNIYLYINLI